MSMRSMRAKPKETSKQLGACSLREKKSNGLNLGSYLPYYTVTIDKPTL